jgi:transcriptional regulator with XRE-family HTH domain
MHKQGIRTPENMALRKDGGVFIKALRTHAGLTQRDVSIALNMKYYTMIAQIEAGTARCPPDSYEALAKVLGVDKSKFVQKLMQYYDPHTYSAIWGSERLDMLDLFKK